MLCLDRRPLGEWVPPRALEVRLCSFDLLISANPYRDNPSAADDALGTHNRVKSVVRARRQMRYQNDAV
jgi:hypothetical protein